MVRSSDALIGDPLPRDQCPLCASTHLRDALVKSAIWQNERLVVVENIPALVCNTCGERYYDDVTSSTLNLMQADGLSDGEADYFIRIPVFSFKGGIPDFVIMGRRR
jgi:YgiT-type zinc finger domain-containing protein